MDKIKIFRKRLKKIGIILDLSCNVPWVYINMINGKRVTEKCMSDYGYALAFLPIRKNRDIQFTDLSEIFKLIRKYV